MNEDAALIAGSLERLYAAMRRMTPLGTLSLTAASTLSRLDRRGPHRLSALATAEDVSQPAMTQLVTRLEREGLVARGSDPSDGRVVVVSVTDAGRAALQERREGRTRRFAALLDGLPEADRAAITAALPALDRLGALVAEEPSG